MKPGQDFEERLMAGYERSKMTKETRRTYGMAAVWFCDPKQDEAAILIEEKQIAPGCGFFGFYKPEVDTMLRKCPSCGNVDTYHKLEDRARIEVIVEDEM